MTKLIIRMGLWSGEEGLFIGQLAEASKKLPRKKHWKVVSIRESIRMHCKVAAQHASGSSKALAPVGSWLLQLRMS